ncbi:MAG TPA: YceD family protein [Nevskiaceae bacterium]
MDPIIIAPDMSDAARVLPGQIRLAELKQGEWSFTGTVAIRELPRVRAACAGHAAPADVDIHLRVERSTRGPVLIDGRIAGVLPLQCQRCLGICEWRFELRPALEVVRGGTQACDTESGREPLELAEEGLLAPRILIEDEILLALPMAPRHAVGQCQPPQP